jgi:uncharacterized protein (DUF1697 family)
MFGPGTAETVCLVSRRGWAYIDEKTRQIIRGGSHVRAPDRGACPGLRAPGGAGVNVYVALLRGVNVAGRRRVGMQALRRSCEALGMTDVVSYVQSGNLVFSSSWEESHALADALEAKLAEDHGVEDVNALVLPAAELEEIVRANPFAPRAAKSGTLYHATFLFRHVPETLFAERELPLQEGEKAVLVGRVVYLYCPGGYAKTALGNAWFEKALGTQATTRNWRTVLALRKLAQREAGAA